MNTDNSILKQIDWTQFTPLLLRAKTIGVEKFKISATGALTKDTNSWVLSKINWDFSPVNPVSSLMEFSTVKEDGTPFAPDTTEDDGLLKETFDFTSGVFKFYFNTETNEIWGEIAVMEGGTPVTYRYIFKFYGAQSVTSKDLLVNQGVCTSSGVRAINSVIAL